jgi:hypothetical protein
MLLQDDTAKDDAGHHQDHGGVDAPKARFELEEAGVVTDIAR